MWTEKHLLSVFQSTFLPHGTTLPGFAKSDNRHQKGGKDQIKSTLSLVKTTGTDETFIGIYDETIGELVARTLSLPLGKRGAILYCQQ